MSELNYWHKIEETIFLPDIGTFFNQDIDKALNIIEQLSESGIKTFKGEILHDANICLDNDTNDAYYGHLSKNIIKENYRSLIERKVVALEDYRTIFNFARKLNMQFIASVYDFAGADFAKEVGCIAIKVATSNITHQALIEYIAKLQLPMIIDTGGSTMEEITRAVNWATDAGNTNILVEHSPPPPPAAVEQHNLMFMKTIEQATGCPIGLSDHHSSEEMLYAATALGAVIVEKGVCDNNIGNEQDAGHAIRISEVKEVAKKISTINKALGKDQRYLPRERVKKTARMGMFAKSAIKQGEPIVLEDIHFAFPAIGIGAEYFGEVKGSTATCDISAGSPINWHHLQK